MGPLSSMAHSHCDEPEHPSSAARQSGNAANARAPCFMVASLPVVRPNFLCRAKGSDIVLGGMRDFFISYTVADRSWAEWIGWQLEEGGYAVVLQAWDIRPGENFALKMNEASQTTKRTVIVLSPDFLDSKFAAAEWASAFVRDPTGQGAILLPIRVRPCEPTGLLQAIVYVDLVGLEEETARRTLLAGVDSTRAKPATAPVFPRGAAERTLAAPSHFPGLPPEAPRAKLTRRLITGALLVSAVLAGVFIKSFGPRPSVGPPLHDTFEPLDARDLETAFVLIDRKARTYLDRARDLKDAFAYVGREGFVDEKSHARLNEAIHPYNDVREEIARNHQQYVLAIRRFAPKASSLGAQVDDVLEVIESVHKSFVLPLSASGKAMNDLVGKTGPEVDQKRDQAKADMDGLIAHMAAALDAFEVDLRGVEKTIKSAL